MLTVEGLVFSSPDRADRSSSWPLPATPPIPNISPTRTEKLIFDKEVPKKSLVLIERLETFKSFSPNTRFFLAGLENDLPTIISPICFALVFFGIQDPTFSPFRRMVAKSQISRISSNLCEIYNIDLPSFLSLRSVSKSIFTSFGVKTDVGSSIISNLGFWSRHLIISTL